MAIRKTYLENNPIHICTKNYLGINLTKWVKDLYLKNCKTLKKIKEDTNKCKQILCS